MPRCVAKGFKFFGWLTSSWTLVDVGFSLGKIAVASGLWSESKTTLSAGKLHFDVPCTKACILQESAALAGMSHHFRIVCILRCGRSKFHWTSMGLRESFGSFPSNANSS